MLDVVHIHKSREFVQVYGDAFSWEGHAVGRSNVTQHEDSRPRWIPPGWVPFHSKCKYQYLIMDVLEKYVIRPFTPLLSTPTELVKKNNRSLIVCVDSWKQNTINTCNLFPLPRVDITLDALRKSQVILTRYLASDYWPFELKESDKV